MDDELNNQNSNGTNNSYQGQDSFASMNPDFNQTNSNQNGFQDPYASMNPDFNQTNSNQNGFQDPYASMNPDFNQPNSNQNGFQDPYASMNPDFNQTNSNQNGFQDPYANMNPDFNQTDSNQNGFQDPYANMNPDFNQSNSNMNVNDVENNNQVVNPILSQSMPNNNVNQEDLNNTNYQDNNFSNPNMSYQDSNFSDPNMNYQNNNFSDPNMNYQNNNFNDSNMGGYQDNGFNDPNMNYQDNNTNQDYNTAFVQAWMGNLFNQAHSKKFNWSAAIFGEIYLLYRKMYLTGFLFLILRYLLIFLSLFLLTKIGVASFAILGVVELAFLFIFGFGFYPLYRNFVKNKLNKCKQTTTDNQQLINLASQKGGTSVLAVVLYCIVIPIITTLLLGLMMTVGLLNLSGSLMSSFGQAVNEINNEIIDEDEFDYQYWQFNDEYSVQYDSITWFYDEANDALAKGSYSLTYSDKSLKDIHAVYGYDLTTNPGRSSLLSTLTSSFEAQATALNVTVQAGSSNFVTGTSLPNVYYSYVDVESAESLSRYYLVLIPDDDILFQFILSTNDTSIDSLTNAEVIGILTSASKENMETEETEETDGNNIDNSISDATSNVLAENDIAEETANEVVENSTTNNVSNVTEVNENLTSYGNEVIASVTNTLANDNSALGEFLR